MLPAAPSDRAANGLLLARTARGVARRCSCGKVEILFERVALTLDAERLAALGRALVACEEPLPDVAKRALRVGGGIALVLEPRDVTELACLVRAAGVLAGGRTEGDACPPAAC